jgi:RNA polymerase sigma factor (sigma-70 family)
VTERRTEDLLRRLAPQVLGAVTRRYGHFTLAEDAVQQALLAASGRWPIDGLPDNPKGWLIRVTSRRLIDLLRSDQARRQREDDAAQWVLPERWLAPAADRVVTGSGSGSGSGDGNPDADDTLIVLFLCCHPSLTPASQIALTLRAVGGLTTAEIARAFLVPEATMTRRITRAKQRIKDSGVGFGLPARAELADRLGAVLHVLYLVFNEGYATTAGPDLHRAELSTEAIRLTRMVRRLLPDDSEVAALLALMLLTDARRPARTGPDGEIVPLADQDRSRWDADRIAEGVALVTEALPRGPTGPYQVQAAIAALHDEAPSADATDWPQILALYEVLLPVADNPMVRLNHTVAVAMVRGPQEALARLDELADDERVAGDHRLHAVRAHLLEMAGDLDAARATYRDAAQRTASIPQQRYLLARAARLAPG